jgi:hypothetical protein
VFLFRVYVRPFPYPYQDPYPYQKLKMNFSELNHIIIRFAKIISSQVSALKEQPANYRAI